MTLQWLRNRAGRLRGIALLFGDGAIVAGDAPKEKEKEGWRLCEGCYSKPAIVFCRVHARYVCEECLQEHNLPTVCNYLSVAAARQLISTVLMKGQSR